MKDGATSSSLVESTDVASITVFYNKAINIYIIRRCLPKTNPAPPTSMSWHLPTWQQGWPGAGQFLGSTIATIKPMKMSQKYIVPVVILYMLSFCKFVSKIVLLYSKWPFFAFICFLLMNEIQYLWSCSWRYYYVGRKRNLFQISLIPFSKHWPSGPMLSISWVVHMCVCMCFCLSVHFWGTFLRSFCPNFPKSDVIFFFIDLKSFGKSNGNKWFRI